MKPLRVTRKQLDPQFQKQEVERVAELIATSARPLAVFCFGSASQSKATDQSDLDFLIVVESAEHYAVARRALRDKMPLSTFPVDIVWKTKPEFLRLREMGGICFVAWREGNCVYCAPGNEREMQRDKEAEI